MSYLKKCLQEGPGCDCVDICKFKPKPPPIPDQRDAEIAQLREDDRLRVIGIEAQTKEWQTEVARLTAALHEVQQAHTNANSNLQLSEARCARLTKALAAAEKTLREDYQRAAEGLLVERKRARAVEAEAAQLRKQVARAIEWLTSDWTDANRVANALEALRGQ